MLPVCEYIILYIYLWNQIHLLSFQFSFRDWVLNNITHIIWLITCVSLVYNKLPVLASTLSAVKTIGIFELSESFFNSRQNPYSWFPIWLIKFITLLLFTYFFGNQPRRNRWIINQRPRKGLNYRFFHLMSHRTFLDFSQIFL